MAIEIIALLILYAFHIGHAFYEAFIDKQLSTIMLPKGVNAKVRHNLMHKYQMPYRGAVIGFSVLAFYGLQWETLIVMVNMSAFFWIVFDIIANVWWLKVKWWRDGTTAGTDKLFPLAVDWLLKIGIFGGTLIWML